ncbi:MAG: diguanylate cyclase with sensor [Frankiales bacterium]|jgi:diguanylate cyclase (GGDEF)-like protein/PAS domain S-box-containing protein|nr:diguanylate cyclase with sensor [Frankiales bacterium]
MAERAARPSSAQPRAEELAGVGRWSLDLSTGTLTTNAAARVLLDWPPDRGEPTLRHFLEAVHPGDRERLAEHTDRLVRTGEEYLLEHRVLLRTGRVLHLRASASADCDADGRPAVLHGVTLDVTELRQALSEAARQRDRGRAVLDGLTDGYLLSVSGVVLEVNPGLCRLTGFSESELVGSGTPYPFWPPDQVAALLEQRRRLVVSGGGEGEMQVLRKDGTRIPVVFTATAIAGSDGSSTLVVLMRDVSDERERARVLEVRAATDPLTGVRNGRAFREELRARVAEAHGGAPLALALFDVDHFKAVNDRFGHAVGDEVLVAVVQRLLGATARRGTLARVGGEEFALLLPGCDGEAGRSVVAAALEALRSEPIPGVGTVTASAGVADLLAGEDEGRLYRRADALMYEAKDRGRDQVR